MVKSVTLFNYQDSDIKITIEVYFDQKNQLVLDGHDFGPKVENVWGKDSYDYVYTIAPDDVRKLAKCLNVDYHDNIGILEEIKKRFSGNRAYSMFGEFMDEHHVKYDSMEV